MNITQTQMTQINALVITLEDDWAKVKPVLATTFTLMPAGFKTAFQYLFNGIDQLVALADNFNVVGADKKALVVAAANKLLNTIIVSALPLALRPFQSPIETILDAVIDGVIEFAVSKLPDPVTPATPTVPATPVKPVGMA